MQVGVTVPPGQVPVPLLGVRSRPTIAHAPVQPGLWVEGVARPARFPAEDDELVPRPGPRKAIASPGSPDALSGRARTSPRSMSKSETSPSSRRTRPSGCPAATPPAQDAPHRARTASAARLPRCRVEDVAARPTRPPRPVVRPSGENASLVPGSPGASGTLSGTSQRRRVQQHDLGGRAQHGEQPLVGLASMALGGACRDRPLADVPGRGVDRHEVPVGRSERFPSLADSSRVSPSGVQPVQYTTVAGSSSPSVAGAAVGR